MHLDSGNGELTIFGDAGNNVGEVTILNPLTLQAAIDGQSNHYSVLDVSKIVFLGFDGDDQFTNATSIEGLLLGNDGDDILVGGSWIDQINGGAGHDELSGNGGDDRIIGHLGNDVMHGGDGDDAMFAGDGTNTVYGNDGDDLIFGGAHVDTIYGGNGMDQLFGLDGNDILDSGDGGTAGSSGTSQADLVMGLNGNDTIYGGLGLNVFYGGEGDDIMFGGDGENRMHGQNGSDQLTGGSSGDYLAGQNDNDTIMGYGGNDYILPGFGDDTVSAGPGTDFVVFSGHSTNYKVTGYGAHLTVEDQVAADGTDSVNDAETFRHSDGDYDAASDIIEVITVQPIIVSNSDGSNTAEYFGSSTQETDIIQTINEIFYQAGVAVSWLAPNYWSDTFANVGNGGTRPSDDLIDITTNGDNAGVGSSDPLVLDLYFVEIAAGYDDVGEYTVNGLAFVGDNGVSIHVGDNLVNSQSGRDLVARVSAHEIAHNLGLDHSGGSNNLMEDGTELNQSQINQILASQYTIPV